LKNQNVKNKLLGVPIYSHKKTSITLNRPVKDLVNKHRTNLGLPITSYLPPSVTKKTAATLPKKP